MAKFLLVLLLAAPLTGCHSIEVISPDQHNECDHPEKPEKPYTDQKNATLLAEQAKVIDRCRALLGHEPRMKV